MSIASQYTIKKCTKELSKTKANAEATDEDFDRDGSELDHLEIKTGENGPSEAKDEEPQSFSLNGPQHKII